MILPLVQYFFYADRQPNYFSSAVLVSLSAQLACLPLSLYYFGGFAILGAISNLIVPPLIPAVMLLSFIVSLGIKFPPLVFVLRIMLKIQVHATEFIGGIPWAMLEVESGRPIYFALYPFILVLLLVVYRLIKHDYRPSYMARGAPQDMVKYIYEN